MRLHEFIKANREQIIERWEQNATRRLSLDLDRSQLRNNLPAFIDDVIHALDVTSDECRTAESAKSHGRQRMRVGVDIGGLTEEMTLVGETIAELARENGYDVSSDELLRMMSIIGQGAAASVGAYASLRDKQLADQAAQHFSFIAHEIRNPLHNALLAAEALNLAPQKERERWLGRLNNSLARLGELVDDSLIEARLYGDPQLKLRRLEARELVERVRNDLADQATEREIDIETRCEDFSLEGDRTILLSALTNLLNNAVKFTRAGGRIVVAARAVDDRARFTVEDECGGIPEHLLPRLFHKFVQARPEKGGSGLGLLIVRQAAEAHHGTVHADNHPGAGCAFTFELPCRQPKEEGAD